MTDANGQVARAQTEFYILTAIWSDEHTITPGETYRLGSTLEGPGFTFTAPMDMPMWIGSYVITEGSSACSEHVAFRVGEPRFAATLFLCTETGAGDIRHFPDGSTTHDGAAVSGFYAEHPLNEAMTTIVDSINTYPSRTRD